MRNIFLLIIVFVLASCSSKDEKIDIIVEEKDKDILTKALKL